MNKVLSFLVILLLVLMCACKTSAVKPSGELSKYSKEFKVNSEFSSLEVRNAIEVKYSVAKETKVTVKANEESMTYLKIEVKRGKLIFFFDTPAGFRGRLSAEVTMSGPVLKSITTFNSADVTFLTPFKTENLQIECYNSGEVEFKQAVELKNLKIGVYNSAEVDAQNLKATMVDVSVFNSADVELGGTATIVNFEAYNSGGIDAAQLVAKSGKASAFNAGTIKCNVADFTYQRFNGGKIKNVH